MKNTVFPHKFWRRFLDCMPQLFFRPQYVWFPVHLKGHVIPLCYETLVVNWQNWLFTLFHQSRSVLSPNPIKQAVQVLLKVIYILLAVDLIKNLCIVCIQIYVRYSRFLHHGVDVNNKKYWSEDRTLWDTTGNLVPLGCNPIDYNFLTPICEEIFDPWQDGLVDAIILQDVYEATAGDRIESLHKVTVYDIDGKQYVGWDSNLWSSHESESCCPRLCSLLTQCPNLHLGDWNHQPSETGHSSDSLTFSGLS